MTPVPVASAPARASTTGGTTYTVAAGDTLWSIAQQLGVSTEALTKANALDNPDALQAGQHVVAQARRLLQALQPDAGLGELLVAEVVVGAAGGQDEVVVWDLLARAHVHDPPGEVHTADAGLPDADVR